MATPSVSSFFISRKRGLEEDVIIQKKKVICLENRRSSNESSGNESVAHKIVYPSSSQSSYHSDNNEHVEGKNKKIAIINAIRQDITPQRTRSKRLQQMQNVEGIETPKIANFYLGSSLSPQKKCKQAPQNESVKSCDPAISENSEQCMKTPTKKQSSSLHSEKKDKIIEKTLLVSHNNVDELKKKIRGSSRLTQLKTSLNKLRDGFDKLDQMEKKRTAATASPSSAIKNTMESNEGKSLKAFQKIELEILR